MSRRKLLVCFFLSGAAGLVYQIVWIRMLSLVVGNTTLAVSTVVAAFLGGLAAGSYLWGRQADKMPDPLRGYVRLEILVAVTAVLVTGAILFIDDTIVAVLGAGTQGTGWASLRFGVVFALLLLPTSLMGGTVPLMGRVYISRLDGLGRGVSSLYAANTYGAAAGSFATGFLLIPLLGVSSTVAVAVFLNVGIALVLWLGSSSETIEKPTEPTEAVRKAAAPMLALALIAVSGFCALAFEILWARAFVLSFKATVYVFSNLLTVFLLGNALGSHLLRGRIDRLPEPLKLFGLAQTGVGILGVVSVVFFAASGAMTAGLGQLVGEMTWHKDVLVTFVMMLGAIGLPTFLMGVSFPLICRAAINAVGEVGRDMGDIYAVGTAAGIAGSLAAGFLLLPGLGLQNSLFAVSAVALLCGWAALRQTTQRFVVPPPTLVAVAVLLIALGGLGQGGIDIGLGHRAPGERVFAKEGIAGTVQVVRSEPGAPLQLVVNNYQLAQSNDIAVRFGHLPLLLHPDAREVLLISLGSGITAGAVGAHPVSRIECVELIPSLVEVQPLFSADNHDIVDDPRFELHLWDGRHHVRATSRRYDLVIADLFQPDSAGVGSLYTLEHFAATREKLAPGGGMAQWLPMYQLSGDDLGVIMRTFAEAFEHVYVFYGDIVSEQPSLLLYGSSSALQLKLDTVHRAMGRPGVRVDMMEQKDVLSLLSAYVMDRDGLLDFTAGLPLNTDDRPVIEYSAPHHLWNRQEVAVENFAALLPHRQEATPLVIESQRTPELAEAVARYYKARTWILEGKLAHAARDYPREIEAYQEAAKSVPRDPVLGAAVLDLGWLYYSNGVYDAAVPLLQWSVQAAPASVDARVLLGRSYEALGQRDKAAAAFEAAERLRSIP